MTWRVVWSSAVVESEFRALPADMRARFLRIADLIVALGLDRVGMPLVRHIEGRIWEIRLKGRDGIARALYVTASGQRVVVLRIFVKKTRATPRREIALALKRAEEIDR